MIREIAVRKNICWKNCESLRL